MIHSLGHAASKEVVDALVLGAYPDARALSLVDIFCAHANPSKHWPFREKTFVDSRQYECNYPGVFLRMDALDLRGKWDVLTCFDGIEHLTKRDGEKLLRMIERVSDSAIVMTPIGPYLMSEDGEHKSAWYPHEFDHAIAFPAFHTTLNLGAFFAFLGRDAKQRMQGAVKSLEALK